MKKIALSLGSLGVLCAAAYLGLPHYCGNVTGESIQKIAKRIENGSMGFVQVKVDDYQKSTRTGQSMVTVSSPFFSDKKLTLQIDTQHGPLLHNDKGWHIGNANLNVSVMKADKTPLAQFQSTLNLKKEFIMEKSIDQQTFKSKEGDLTLALEKAHLKVTLPSAASSPARLTLNANTLAFSVKESPLGIDASYTFHNPRMHVNGNLSENNLFVGESNSSYDRVDITEKVDGKTQKMSLDEAKATVSSEDNGQEYSIRIKESFAKFHSDFGNFGPIVVDVEIPKLDSKALSELSSKATGIMIHFLNILKQNNYDLNIKLSQQQEMQMGLSVMELMGPAMKLAHKPLTYRVNQFQISSKSGDINFNGTFQLNDIAKYFGTNPQAALQKALYMDAHLSFNRNIIKDFLEAANAIDKLAANGADATSTSSDSDTSAMMEKINQQLDMFQQQGFIKINGDDITLDLSVKDGSITLNGKQIPWPSRGYGTRAPQQQMQQQHMQQQHVPQQQMQQQHMQQQHSQPAH